MNKFTLTKGCVFYVLCRVHTVIVIAIREGQHDLHTDVDNVTNTMKVEREHSKFHSNRLESFPQCDIQQYLCISVAKITDV